VHYFFFLLPVDFRGPRADVFLTRLFFPAVAVARFGFFVPVARLFFFLDRGAMPGIATWRIFVDTVSGSVEMFSVNPWATLLRVPAAYPSFRATVFNRGSFTGRLSAVIGFLQANKISLP
jgi:hypothetical protein